MTGSVPRVAAMPGPVRPNPSGVQAPPDAAGPGGDRPPLPERLAFNPIFPKTRHRQIGRMIVAGGFWSLGLAAVHLLIAAWAATTQAVPVTVTGITGVLLAGTGVVCLMRGARLNSDRAWLEPPPFFPAALLMLSGVACDPVGLILGGIVTAWLFDLPTRRFYHG